MARVSTASVSQGRRPPAPDPFAPPGPLPIGISACLVGEKVRYNGDHSHDAYITGTLGAYFRFVAVCPEMEIGLGAPREPIRLIGSPAAPRALGTATPELDVTEALTGLGRRKAGELSEIRGYLFKSRSPSCGMERVKVYAPGGGRPRVQGRGLYAAAFMAAQPLLPVEEEGRLGEPALRESFIERVYAYHRWRTLVQGGLTVARLRVFHERHKLALMVHGAASARELDHLVAQAEGVAPVRLAVAYGAAFMAHLGRRATPRKHAAVLMHLMGHLKRHLDAGDKAELLEAIGSYRWGRLPLVVPVALLNHYFRRYPHPSVTGQTYLDPCPAERMLRGGG